MTLEDGELSRHLLPFSSELDNITASEPEHPSILALYLALRTVPLLRTLARTDEPCGRSFLALPWAELKELLFDCLAGNKAIYGSGSLFQEFARYDRQSLAADPGLYDAGYHLSYIAERGKLSQWIADIGLFPTYTQGP